jgi:hypothetical protein
MNSLVTPKGQLIDRFIPAIYFDSSVLIDYWMTDGMELPDKYQQDLTKLSYGSMARIITDLLQSDIQLNNVAEIRKRYYLMRLRPTWSRAMQLYGNFKNGLRSLVSSI